jgi:hypothetical protein
MFSYNFVLKKRRKLIVALFFYLYKNYHYEIKNQTIGFKKWQTI